MTQRERSLLLVFLALGAFVVLAGGGLVIRSAWNRVDQKQKQLEALDKEIAASRKKVNAQRQARLKLENWKTISLAPDLALAGNRYRIYLQDLCRRHEVRMIQDVRQVSDSGSLRTTGSKSQFSALTYTLKFECTLSRLMGFLAEFHATNYPHQVRSMIVTVKGSAPDVREEVEMRVEVLAMQNIPPRDYLPATPDAAYLQLEALAALMNGPTGLALASWSVGPTGLHGSRKLAVSVPPVPGKPKSDRNYRDMVTRKNFNIFAGKLPPSLTAGASETKPNREVLKDVRLTDISDNLIRREAWLRNQKTEKTRYRDIRLREAPFDVVEVRDDNDLMVLSGKVKFLEPDQKAVANGDALHWLRDLVIVVEGKYYAWHIGHTLDQALERELTQEERKPFEATSTTAAENP